MHYELYRTYTTGDSFNSYRRTESLGLVWTNRTLAEAAFDSVKEHYRMYLVDDDPNKRKLPRRRRPNKSYEETDNLFRYFALSRPWSVAGYTQLEYKPDVYLHFWWYHFAVLDDNNEYRRLDVTGHCGYFETLHELFLIEVEATDDLDHIVVDSGYNGVIKYAEF